MKRVEKRVGRVVTAFDLLYEAMRRRRMRMGPGGATGGDILRAAVDIVAQEDAAKHPGRSEDG